MKGEFRKGRGLAITDRERFTIAVDDYYTPKWIFDRMAIRFDIDVCAPPGGLSWIPADNSYDIDRDGLTSPWTGRIWMNPPYSRPASWVQRFIRHHNGVALLPFAKSPWFFELWSTTDAAVVVPGPDASDFVVPGGVRARVFMPVFLAAFGEDCVEAIGRLGRVR